MSLSNLITYKPDPYINNERIRYIFTTHLYYLRNHVGTVRVDVKQAIARPFYYDLYAYLTAEGYAINMHWPILIINDLKSPAHFDGTVKSLLIPDLSEIESILVLAES